MSFSVYDLTDNVSLYQVLNLPRNATDKDIRQAYYRLAVLYHPDKNPDGDEMFKEISFAYNILGDREQRAKYDSNTLRSYLHCQARTYDPTMDPDIDLSQDELRRFVERIRSVHEEKSKKLSDFERRREEEMKRRAEYDARHPDFKKEYEMMRKSRRPVRDTVAERTHSLGRQARSLRSGVEATANNENSTLYCTGSTVATRESSWTYRSSNLCSDDPRFVSRYSANEQSNTIQRVAELQEDERSRLYSDRPKVPLIRATNLYNIKKKMMEEYKREQEKQQQQHHHEQQPNSEQHAYLEYMRRSSPAPAEDDPTHVSQANCEKTSFRSKGASSCIPHVENPNKASIYSNTIGEKLRTHTNFDYLAFVEKDMVDGGALDGAILADALMQYDRTH